MDTVRERTFSCRCGGRTLRLTLKPCEIRMVKL